MTVFFEAETLVVDERPDRSVVDVQTALGQLGDQATQGEATRTTTDEQPVPMLARNFPRLVATHLPRRGASGSTDERSAPWNKKRLGFMSSRSSTTLAESK